MSLTITCSCGARLEIDDRFAGQVIPCPDCQAPLPLPAPEPLRHRRVSGLAVTGLMLSLVGAFTVVGAAVGLLLGFLARRRIARDAERLTGEPYARAAMIVGGAGVLVTLFALALPAPFYLDAVLREFRWATRLDYSPLAAVPPEIVKTVPGGDRTIALVVPSRRWGLWQPRRSNASDPSDLLILIDAWDDAQIACQSLDLNGDEQDNWDAARAAGLKRVRDSELLALLDPDHAAEAEPKPRDIKQRDDGSQEMLVDLRTGVERTFLVRMSKKDHRLFIVVGAARKHRFARLQDELRKGLDSFQVKS